MKSCRGLLLLLVPVIGTSIRKYPQEVDHSTSMTRPLQPFQPVLSFAPPPSLPIQKKKINYSTGRRQWWCKPKPSYRLSSTQIMNAKQPTNNCEFELQEVRAQFQSFLKQNIRPKMLPKQTRQDIERYMEKIIRDCPSPIRLKSMADDSARIMHGNWTLVFSSENAALGDLPRDSTIRLSMYPDFKCDFKIQFQKSLALKSLTARSSYIVDSSPMTAGRVTIIYQDIVFDAFGFKSFPAGFFGVLKGRATTIETVWFDGRLWFERGYTSDGYEYYNVYMKD